MPPSSSTIELGVLEDLLEAPLRAREGPGEHGDAPGQPLDVLGALVEQRGEGGAHGARGRAGQCGRGLEDPPGGPAAAWWGVPAEIAEDEGALSGHRAP